MTEHEMAVFILAHSIPLNQETTELRQLILQYLHAPATVQHGIRLDTAITLLERGLIFIQDGHVNRAAVIGRLGNLCQSRFVNNPSPCGDDIDKAIFHHSQAAQLASDVGDKCEWLNSLGDSYLRRFDRFGASMDIDTAVDYKRQAALLLTDEHLDKPGWLNNLAISLQKRFERFGNICDINEAIDSQTLAASLIPDKDPDRLNILSNLGNTYRARFRHLGKSSDINIAIELQTQAALGTPNESPENAVRCCNLGTSHLARFDHSGKISDLEQAIITHQKAIACAPNGGLSRFAILCQLAKAFTSKFESMGKVEDLDKAFSYLAEATLPIGYGGSYQSVLLEGRSQAYLARYERFGSMEDLEEGISSQKTALDCAPQGHPDIPRLLNRLGNLEHHRFVRHEQISDIDAGISHQKQALSLVLDNHATKPALLNSLGASYMSRFICLGRIQDIEDSVAYSAQSVELIAEGSIHKPKYLGNLGSAYALRFERLNGPQDIEQAIKFLEEAISLVSEQFLSLPGWLSNLGTTYLIQFNRFGEPGDIEKAVEHQTRALSLTPDGHADKPAYLDSLGNSLRSRFGLKGQLRDIDDAITFQSQAVSSTLENDASLPGRLHNLGISYRSRYIHLKDLADIDNGVRYQSRAIALGSKDHSDRHAWLSGLGNSHRDRFERSGALSDVNEAINCLSEAVMVTPKALPHKCTLLTNLGNAHYSKFKLTLGLEDINSAISCHNEALLSAPAHHPSKPTLLSNLACSYLDRFQHTGEPDDSDKSILLGNQAITLAPEGYINKPFYLNQLGDAYFTRFNRLGVSDALELSVECFRRSAESFSGTISSKFYGARRWAMLAYSHHIYSPIVAFKQAMALLPQAIWLGATVQSRLDDVSTFGDIVLAAAAAAIKEGLFDLALEWLEEGRSIVWKQMLQFRTPLEELRSVDATLAGQLEEVGFFISRNGLAESWEPSLASTPASLEQMAQQHRRLAERWEQLVEEARKLAGFRNFLRPKDKNELIEAARPHPVVLINVHASRCDALAMLPDSTIAHIPLPTLSYEKSVTTQEQISRSLSHADFCDRNKRGPVYPTFRAGNMFESALETLWEHVTKPVLAQLGYLEPNPLNPLPHITWCATGPLAFLPLHAAGSYNTPNERIFNLVISSYTPTISALLGEAMTTEQFRGILAVGQAATANQNPLPGTIAELDQLEKMAGDLRFTRLDEHLASPANVLSNMETHSWVHLACHAAQDRINPVKSSFHLHGGALGLNAIAQKSLACANFAFLSACETALGDEKFSDEAVHLAAGMVFAGYSGVIATMWSIQDSDAPHVSEKVYTRLLGEGVPDSRRAGEALHFATESLRARAGEKAFARWVPYIHIGK